MRRHNPLHCAGYRAAEATKPTSDIGLRPGWVCHRPSAGARPACESPSVWFAEATIDVVGGPLVKRIVTLLRHPLTRGLDLDDPRTTVLRQQIVREKGFLSRVYSEWSGAIRDAVPTGAGRVLELGSGGGILREFIPDVLTSNVLALPQLDVIATGEALPFAAASLKAIVKVWSATIAFAIRM